MSDCSGFVKPAPMTSGICQSMESLAEQFSYSDGVSVRRVVMAGRMVGVVYDSNSRVFSFRGFTSGAVTGVFPGGVHNYVLEAGTIGVCPEMMSGSPVSGLPYVVDFHPRKHPSVDLNVPCSGVWARLNELKETEEGGLARQVSRPPTIKITEITPPRPPKPDLCWKCQSRAIAWDSENSDWICLTCHRLQTIT